MGGFDAAAAVGRTLGRSSFADLLAHAAPEALPRAAASGPGGEAAPHGTTIVCASFDGGVAIAGDRRATWASQIVQNDIEKVFPADAHSVIGVAGTAGVALDLVRLFQVELEHYEKIEGVPLSFEGKANRLGGLIRARLDGALRGLGVLPVLVGWDGAAGRIVSYDIVGGRYAETGFYAVGSGAPFARGSLKKLHRPTLDAAGAVTALLQSLVDAADDDSATAGPDAVRRLYPLVCTVDADGVRRWADADVEALAARVLAARRERPDGPGAPLL